ncbi:MAG: ribbon-helix-helix domain-containing protein [Thermoplasmata archaeon]
MQSKGKRKPTVSFRLPTELLLQVDELVGKTGMRSRTELIERAVEAYVDELKETKVVRVQPHTEAEARVAILRYLEDQPGTYVSDLAEALAMDVELAFRVVASLAEEGKVIG